MGNWHLEVARMAMYMTFPVALFHLFNQPEYFEDWVKNTRRELYPPESKTHREEIQKAINEIREQQDLEILKAYEKTK